MDEQINNQEELNQTQPAESTGNKPKRNKTPFLIAGLVILTGILVILAVPIKQGVNTKDSPSASPQLEKAILSISQPQASGSAYSAQIEVDSKDYTVSGADLVIKYDPKVIYNFKVSGGDLIENPTVLYTNVDQQKGIATYSAVAGISSEGVKGKGSFAVITFNVYGSPSANTTISFLKETQVAAEGQTVSVLGDSFGVSFIPGTK